MGVKKEKYEISLWEDYIVPQTEIAPEHYEEKKLAVIGSNTMTAQFRALEPRLIENINGTHTFTFKMNYSYIDVEDGIKKENPFLKLLVNERKIKVFWKSKWYDLIIKSCQEDSNGKSITFTCKDLFINELSKNGFDLEFNSELQNNQGTIDELADKILLGSDWQREEGDLIQQTKEEPVYELTGVQIPNEFEALDENGKNYQIDSSSKILLYYSIVQQKSSFVQFLYEDEPFTKDLNNLLVINGKKLQIEPVEWKEENDYINCYFNNKIIFQISNKLNVSNNYRAKRLVRSQKQIFDPLTEKYVYEYTLNNKKVYGYEETEFTSPIIVNNLLVNSSDFSSTEGWSNGSLEFSLYPPFNKDVDIKTYSARSFLKLSADNTYFNSGIQQNIHYLEEGFQSGEKYIFRIKAVANPITGVLNKLDYLHSGFEGEISEYTISKDGSFVPSKTYFEVKSSRFIKDWLEYEMICNTSISRSDLLIKNVGFFLTSNKTCWIEEIQFFPYKEGLNSSGEKIRINPGEIDTQGVAQLIYKYYYSDLDIKNKDEIEYLYKNTEPWNNADLIPVYNNNFEKIRSITAKNSNRFNLLQNLAETFESWIKFRIEHDEETGRVLYNSDGTPRKFISFWNEIGQETGVGFIYGIDLKTISRTINSDQITTKVIVTPNTNEFAQDGFCTIARSKENYSKENFILNFDYYISHGLLDGAVVNKDLYQSTDAIGYYYWLNQYNLEYDALSKEIVNQKNELLKEESLLEVYNGYITSLNEEIVSLEADISSLISLPFDNLTSYLSNNPNDTKVLSLSNTRTNLINNRNNYIKQKDNLTKSVEALKTYILKIEKQQDNEDPKEGEEKGLIQKIEDLHQTFYNKYSRFMQEGSWNSQDYIDDNLYYLDALDVAYTSSRPQISYNISVLRLSALEEYKNKIFKIGDISYIQDTEFFGYTYSNGLKTPYKEKILVSEITSFFDSPEKDSFRVQNYKTQFEDLFQRITATTQNLQYASGEYQRAANAFTETGEIDPLTLQNSINYNQNLVISAQNDSVITDKTGVTVTDITNPNKKVKITSGGIFISTDGGNTWKNAIRGDGISTSGLTAGSIRTNNIILMDGNHTSFRWDADGINSYYTDSLVGTLMNTFVRFDHHGIYGIKNYNENKFEPTNEDDIWNAANFGMTWKGFFVKNRQGLGSVEVSSENDILVQYDNKEIIKIGRLSGLQDDTVYGIRINNNEGKPVLETDNSGSLWLKNKLSISSTEDNYDIGIGRLEGLKQNTDNIHEIFNANSKFMVYEDGSIKATEGEFTGTIHAKGGTIGGVNISSFIDILNGSEGLQLIPRNGTIFTVEEGADLSKIPSLNFELNSTEEIVESNVKWYISNDFSSWEVLLEGSKTLELTYQTFNSKKYNGTCFIKVEYNNREVWETINEVVTKIPEDVETNYYMINTNQEEILKFIEEEDNEEGYLTTFSPPILNIEVELNNNLLNSSEYEIALEINRDFNKEQESVEGIATIDDEANWFSLDFLKNSINGKTILYSSNSIWYLLIEELVNLNIEDILDEENKIKIQNLKGLLNGDEFYLRIKIYRNGKVVAIKPISIRFANSAETAKLSIHSSGITAAIRNTKISFGEEGLTAFNGGLKIKNKNDELVFDADENGNLIVKGHIEASSGIFNGTVKADKITIKSGELESLDITGILRVGADSENESFIVLNGEQKSIYSSNFDDNIGFKISNDGHIVANSITLGTGAKIEDYINLGNCWIYNPQSEQANGNFILVKDENKNKIQLNSEGYLKLGETIILNSNNETIEVGGILLNGINQTVTSNNFSQGAGWQLSNDTSIFNNIVASGSIKSSILEYGSVQGVGGILVVRPSSIIKTAEREKEGKKGIKITVENQNGFKTGDYCYIGDNFNNREYYKIEVEDPINDEGNSSDSQSTGIRILDGGQLDFSSIIGKPIISFTDGEIGIGINSSDNGHFVSKKSISIFETKIEENSEGKLINFINKPRIILGEVPSYLVNDKIGFYGLYADNVFLKGSLIASDNSSEINYSSGINTASEAMMTEQNWFPGKTLGNILLWAGANSNSKEDIEAAPFKVDIYGNLYAGSGYFNGTIITDATITAAEIMTAKITGTGASNNLEAGLTISDVNNAIRFIKTVDGIEHEIMTLTSGALTLNVPLRLGENAELNIKNLTSFPYIYITENDKIGTLIRDNKIGFITEGFDTVENISYNGYFEYKKPSMTEEEGYYFYVNNSLSLIMNENTTQIKNRVVIDSDVSFGEIMEYVKVIDEYNQVIGYDLYID